MHSDGVRGNGVRGDAVHSENAPGAAGLRDARSPLRAIAASRPDHGWLVPVACAALFALLPMLVSPYAQDLAAKIALYAVFALSLHLLVGMTGLVSLGHAAFLGVGAYVTVLASGDGAAPLLKVLPLSVLAAAAYALFVGALSLRTRGVYFIMVTLAFAQMAYFVFHDTKVGGGSDGIFLYTKPVVEIDGSVWLDLGNRLAMFYAVLAALVFTYAAVWVVARSRFGHALAGIRVNEARMRAAGFATYRYKLAVFVLAGALAGLAGSLLAIKDGAVNPELLAWQESGAVLLMVILGGIGSARGAVIGAVAFTLLRELFQSEALLGPLASHWQLTFGLTIIAAVAWLPKGLIGLGRTGFAWRQRSPRPAPASGTRGHAQPPVPPAGASHGEGHPPRKADPTSTHAPNLSHVRGTPILQAVALTRRFGGLTAVDAVSLDFRIGEIHAVIGTNGAGKSTFIDMLAGDIVPNGGRVMLGGVDVTAWSRPRRARAGLGRSFQRTTIFPEFSALENCRLCAQAATPRAWQMWAAARHCVASTEAAWRALDAAGLTDSGSTTAATLSHGQKRQLEIAMSLATDPRVLLLDEPLAGMGAEETGRMLELLVSLRATHALLLVEHDMDAVFKVADRITVMVDGRVIASGEPAMIRGHREVVAAYLGDAHPEAIAGA